MASERPALTRARLFYLLALAAILLLAACLRFYRLDASSLWSDEGNTWAMLDRSFGEIAGAAAADIHPPGYYWLLKLWSGVFGASAWAMRSFSALAGVLLVLVIERVGRRIGAPASSRALPLLAALAAAVNPLLVYYSQEARMYMLLALLGAGVFWALLGMRDFLEVPPPPGSPPTSRRWSMCCARRWGCGRTTALRLCWRRPIWPGWGAGYGCAMPAHRWRRGAHWLAGSA